MCEHALTCFIFRFLKRPLIKASEDRSKAHAKAGTDVVATSIRMSKATHMRLKLAAVTEGTSITEIIDTAVNMYLDGIISRKEVDDEDGL